MYTSFQGTRPFLEEQGNAIVHLKVCETLMVNGNALTFKNNGKRNDIPSTNVPQAFIQGGQDRLQQLRPSLKSPLYCLQSPSLKRKPLAKRHSFTLPPGGFDEGKVSLSPMQAHHASVSHYSLGWPHLVDAEFLADYGNAGGGAASCEIPYVPSDPPAKPSN